MKSKERCLEPRSKHVAVDIVCLGFGTAALRIRGCSGDLVSRQIIGVRGLGTGMGTLR